MQGKSVLPPRGRLPLLALGGLGLLVALWGGLVRIGWAWPLPATGWVPDHGPLMVGAFLGTVISLERAVALERPWAYLGPVAAGLAGLALILGLPASWAGVLLLLSSLVLLAIFRHILALHAALFTWTMAGGALFWAVGNLLWLVGLPVSRVVWWWAGFLVLTIAGERLELSRLLRLGPAAQGAFGGAVTLFALGALAATVDPSWGGRAVGLGLLAVALWLLRYDIAGRRLRATGQARYAAICLLGGYVWLAVGGVLALAYGNPGGGPVYDAMLHAVFLGFVFAMIFAHAPIILPAVVGLAVPFRRAFYTHLALLHLSMVVRLAGDLAGNFSARRWGGLLGALAIVLFLVNTVRAVRSAHSSDDSSG